MREKSSGVSFANFVAVIGLVLFGVFTYFGQMFLSSGQLGVSLLWAVGFTVVAASLLVFMIRAKGADNNFGLWRTVEYITLGVYLLFAALTFRAPVLFVGLMTDRSEAQRAGLDDIERIEGLYADYEEFESNALTTTNTGLLAAVNNPSNTAQLKAFCAQKQIADSETSVNSYCQAQRRLLLGDVYEGNKANTEKELAAYRSIIQGWNVFSMPLVDRKLAELGEKVAAELTEVSAQAALPVVTGGYIEKENQKKMFEAPRVELADKLQGGTGNVFAWIGLVLIHLLILFNYIAAGRSDKPRKQVRQVDSGFVLGDDFDRFEQDKPAGAPQPASRPAAAPVQPVSPAGGLVLGDIPTPPPAPAPAAVPPVPPVSGAAVPPPVPPVPPVSGAAVPPPVPPVLPVPGAAVPSPVPPVPPVPGAAVPPPVPPVPPVAPADGPSLILGE